MNSKPQLELNLNQTAGTNLINEIVASKQGI